MWRFFCTRRSTLKMGEKVKAKKFVRIKIQQLIWKFQHRSCPEVRWTKGMKDRSCDFSEIRSEVFRCGGCLFGCLVRQEAKGNPDSETTVADRIAKSRWAKSPRERGLSVQDKRAIYRQLKEFRIRQIKSPFHRLCTMLYTLVSFGPRKQKTV